MRGDLRMEFQLQKCPTPLIWLDTSVIIELTKYREKLEMKDLQRNRMSRLNEVIYTKTREGKLLVVEGDQREEIDSHIKETQKTHAFLSQGIRLQYRKSVHNKQLYKYMKAFINKQETIYLVYHEAFNSDPLHKLHERNGGNMKGLIITILSDIKPEEIKSRGEVKGILFRQLERIRQNNVINHISYEQQLQDEYLGRIKAYTQTFTNMKIKISNRSEITEADMSQFALFTEMLEMWNGLNGIEQELTEFLISDHYKAIPYIDIACKLFAKILTSKAPVLSGDVMDVEHISTVLPYCDYVVTDQKMKNRIIELKLNSKYNTKVYCLKDTNELVKELEDL